MRRAAAQRGFTLIEVLVALVLLALLLAGAWGGIRTAVKAIHSGDLAIERMNRLRVSEQFLRRQLSLALPLAFARDDASGENHLFQGEGDFMRFVAPMPGYLSRGGAYVQTLRLTRTSGGMELTFSNVMLGGYEDEAELDDAEPLLLVDGIRGGEFLYRGLDEEGELGDWVDVWEEPAKTPVMVRIDLEMTPESGMTWPVLDVPLMLDAASLPRAARSRQFLPNPGTDGGFQRGQPVREPRGQPARQPVRGRGQ